MKSTPTKRSRKKETKLAELERRIKYLEDLSKLPPLPALPQPHYNFPQPAPYHYHGTIPCYINPCYWC